MRYIKYIYMTTYLIFLKFQLSQRNNSTNKRCRCFTPWIPFARCFTHKPCDTGKKISLLSLFLFKPIFQTTGLTIEIVTFSRARRFYIQDFLMRRLCYLQKWYVATRPDANKIHFSLSSFFFFLARDTHTPVRKLVDE